MMNSPPSPELACPSAVVTHENFDPQITSCYIAGMCKVSSSLWLLTIINNPQIGPSMGCGEVQAPSSQ